MLSGLIFNVQSRACPVEILRVEKIKSTAYLCQDEFYMQALLTCGGTPAYRAYFSFSQTRQKIQKKRHVASVKNEKRR